MQKYFIFFLFIITFQVFSQTDTLHYLSKTKPKTTFVINADFRQSFVKNSPITIYGGYFGLKFKQKNLYSLGFYVLADSSKQRYKNKNLTQAIPVNDEVSLWFLSFGYTRTIYDGRIFKVDIPAEIGFGNGSTGIYNVDGTVLRIVNSKVYPLQIGLSTTIKVTRWFGVHLQAGYRDMLGKSLFQNDYSGLYYTYGINFNFGRIYQDLKK